MSQYTRIGNNRDIKRHSLKTIHGELKYIESEQTYNKIMAADLFAFLCVDVLSGRSSDRQTKQLKPTADTASLQVPGEGFSTELLPR